MSINLALSRIFLISSDSNFSQHLATFNTPNFEFSIFENWDSVFQKIYQRPSVIFLDLDLESTGSILFLDKMLDLDKNIPIILISKNNNITDPEILSRSNVYNVFRKEDLTNQYLHFLLRNIYQSNQLQSQLEQFKINTHQDLTKNIIYNCGDMERVVQLINKASLTNIACYISGEQGTGKGEIAYLIHYLSNRKRYPYVYIKLSTIEPTDLEKEFFGIEDHQNQNIQKGKLELASKGTLYIEDIHLMPLSFQSKLLHTIKSGYFQKVGGDEKIKLDIRLIASTSGNLLEEMEEGHFSESLYYRLMGLSINIPPLKDRENDIILLATDFINKFSKKNNFPKKTLSKEAKYKLLSYSFPGNIRELKSIIERAIVLADNDTILEEDIEFGNTSNQISFLAHEMTFEEYKSKIIHHFLSKYDNDIQIVSTRLDIGKSTIYRMLKSEKEKNTKKMSWFNMF